MEYEKRDNNNRVCVRAVVVRDNHLLVIKRIKNGEHFAVLPGGGVDDGEKFEDAVVRETYEETNVTVKCQKLIYDEPKMEGFPKTYYFLCDYISGEPELVDYREEAQRNSESNHYQPSWLDLNQPNNDIKPDGILQKILS